MFPLFCYASQCVDEEGNPFEAAVVDNRTQCLDGGHEWVTSFPNFDNALNGYLSLVHVAIFKGWVPIMYDAVDSRQVSSAPCVISFLSVDVGKYSKYDSSALTRFQVTSYCLVHIESLLSLSHATRNFQVSTNYF